MRRDELREALSRTLVWLSEHAKQIAIGLAVVVLALVAWTLLSSRVLGRQDRASDDLAAAIATLEAPLTSELSPGVSPEGEAFATDQERRLEARRRFEAVAAEYPRSSSARVARAYVATMDYRQGDPDAAREAWDELVSGGGDDLLTLQALLNILTVDRETGRAAEAESRLLALVDNPRSPMPRPQVLYELAVTQEALDKAAESRATYQRLVDEHPESPLARAASARLAQAQGTA
jgi:predicted negative regulator of RcsB-dependent stress response